MKTINRQLSWTSASII